MSKRKSFIIHHDSLDVIDKLSDEQAGKLLKAIKAYQLDEEYELDLTTDLVLTPFKAQFKRDEEKYKNIVNRNKNNGLKGGRPKKEQSKDNQEKPTGLIGDTEKPSGLIGDTEKPSGLIGNPEEPQKADSDSDSDSDSKSDSNTKEISVSAKQKRSKFKFNSEDMRFSEEMFKRILLISATAKKPNFDNWANTIRLMREADSRDHHEMWRVFDWANKDPFWSTNILSPDKLRKKYDELNIKSQMTGRTNQGEPKRSMIDDLEEKISNFNFNDDE